MTFAGLLSALLLATPQHGWDPGRDATSLVSRDTLFGRTITTEQDAAVAVREGEAAFSAARDVLGLSDVRFVIVDAAQGASAWGELAEDGAVIYPWIFGSGAGNQAPRAPDYVLRHEIGHDLFIRHLVPNTRAGQYGGDAPDWLDEMAAVAFEDVEQQAARRRLVMVYVRQGELMPLHRFLTMTHPELSSDLPDIASGDLYRVRRMMSGDTPQFYALARAFYDFLVARTGTPAIVAELAGAVRSGEPLNDWILSRTAQGDAGTVETLNVDFLAWLAADPRYGGTTSGQG